MKLRIQTRYSLIILSLIMLVIVVLAGALLIGFRVSMDEVTRSSSELMAVGILEQLRSKGETLALFLAQNLTPLVLQYDIVAIFEIAQATLKQKDVVYVYIYDQEGKIIHDGTEEISLYGKLLDDEISKRALAAKNLFTEATGKMVYIQVTENIVDIAAPIKIGDSLLGGVRVGLTSKEINDDIEDMKSQVENINRKGIRKNVLTAILIGIGSSIIGVILTVIVSRGLSRPIQSLTEQTRRVGRGEYDVGISVKRNDEIGELADSFRIMAQDLQRTTVSKDYVDGILKSMINTLIVVDPRGKIQRVNQATLDLLGYEEDELIGRPSTIIFDGGILPFVGEGDNLTPKEVLRNVESTYLSKAGEKIPVLFSGSVMHDEGGSVGGIVCVAQDITERMRAEEVLKRNEERYHTLVETIAYGIEDIDISGNIIFANSAHHKQYDYPQGELIGKNIVDLVATEAERELLRDNLKFLVIEQPPPTPYFGQKITKTGRVIDVQIEWDYRRDLKGRVVGFTSVITDISERIKAEEQIKASLREKEVLLKEIHHRVKNNLQIISSLLNLQADYIKEEWALNMFKESRDRVRSMALIHEKLYQSKDLAWIDFGEYIGNLTSYLFQSYGVNGETIVLKNNAKGILLNIDTAIPCGLIVNELVSNSLKHAFSEGEESEIFIDFDLNADHGFALKVGDNGIGLPKGLDFRKTQSLGLQLVTTLVDQLEGTIALEDNDGTTFRITFTESNHR